MKKNLLILILWVISSALTAYLVVKITDKNSKRNTSYVANPTVQNVNLSDKSYPDFTFAAETAVKSVVNVKVLQKGIQKPYSIYDFFFGYGSHDSYPQESERLGSGVIIRADGYIITNNHVIVGADEISVTTEDNNTYKAKLIGADPVTDIAILKIDARNLPFMNFGESDALRLGEWVIAIGNPYNLTSTITAGIVSAKARSMPSESGEFKIESFIQTDAAVNPGNSGGALVNTQGELVGINTAIASRTGSFTGYSFAIPSSIAKKIVEDMIDFGMVQRAILGISMQEIDSELAKAKKINMTKGIYIAEVAKGGSADKAGVKVSDVLVSINGIEVNSGPAVQEQISKYRPNDKIRLGIVRNGKQKEFSVVLTRRSGSIVKANDVESVLYQLFGAILKKAPKESLKNLDLSSGVEVVSVAEGKFERAGIQKGFIITHINQFPVADEQDVENVVKKSRRSILIEGVYPNGKLFYYGIGL